MRKIQGMSKRGKNLPHTLSLPEKNPEKQREMERRDKTEQGRIPEIVELPRWALTL